MELEIRIGNRGHTAAEHTEFGWTTISGGRETTQNHTLFTTNESY